MKSKRIITVGSFQPFTPGHMNLVNKMKELSDDCDIITFNKSDVSKRMVGNKSFTNESLHEIIKLISGKYPLVYNNLYEAIGDCLSQYSELVVVLGQDSEIDLKTHPEGSRIEVIKIPRNDGISGTQVRKLLSRNDRQGLLDVGYTEFQIDRIYTLLSNPQVARTGIKHLYDYRTTTDYQISDSTIRKLFDYDSVDLSTFNITEKVDGYRLEVGNDEMGFYGTSSRSKKVYGSFLELDVKSQGAKDAYKALDVVFQKLKELNIKGSAQFEVYNKNGQINYSMNEGDCWLIKSTCDIPMRDWIHSNKVRLNNSLLDLSVFRKHIGTIEARKQLHEELLKRCGIGIEDEREGIVLEKDGEIFKCVTKTYLNRQFNGIAETERKQFTKKKKDTTFVSKHRQWNKILKGL